MHLGAVSAPVADLELVRQSSRRVLRAADALTDAQVAAPCDLPGWSRAELLTHLARNADGFRMLAEAAGAGEVGVMYPGGPEQRARDIAAGRSQPAAAVLRDLRRAVDALAEVWQRLSDSEWDAAGRMATGEYTVRDTVSIRLQELEVHHVDLDVGYTPTDWPVAFVGRALDRALRTLPARAAADRPEMDARYRIEATDHGRAWTVILHGSRVAVARHTDDDTHHGDPDAVVSGWGCDLLAWMLGRNTGADTVTASGNDVSALRLSTWFPYS
jgi:maleylpyruvate isomerase